MGIECIVRSLGKMRLVFCSLFFLSSLAIATSTEIYRSSGQKHGFKFETSCDVNPPGVESRYSNCIHKLRKAGAGKSQANVELKGGNHIDVFAHSQNSEEVLVVTYEPGCCGSSSIFSVYTVEGKLLGFGDENSFEFLHKEKSLKKPVVSSKKLTLLSDSQPDTIHKDSKFFVLDEGDEKFVLRPVQGLRDDLFLNYKGDCIWFLQPVGSSELELFAGKCLNEVFLNYKCVQEANHVRCDLANVKCLDRNGAEVSCENQFSSGTSL